MMCLYYTKKNFIFLKTYKDKRSCKLIIASDACNRGEMEEEKASAVHMTFSRGSRTSGHYVLSWP